MSKLLIFLALLNAYLVVLYVLHRTGRLGKSFDLVLGVLLMWRTQRGKAAVDAVATPKRFWSSAGDVGILLTVVAGAFTLLLLVLQVILFAAAPQEAARSTPGAEYLLGIPGFNPLIPLGYGIFGLIVALVIHEGAHAVLARAGDVKVKSMGLLFAIVPIGAFVEPDEEELEKAGTRRRLRVFAAGPASNLVLAIVTAVLFSGVVMASTSFTAPEGILLLGVNEGTGAEEAGLRAGDMITHIDGRPVRNATEFSARLNQSEPGDTVVLRLVRDGAVVSPEPRVRLVDRYDWFAAHAPSANAESNKGRPFLGVGHVTTRQAAAYRGILEDPVQSPVAFGIFIYHPFLALTTYDPLSEPYRWTITVEGPLAALGDGFFVLANGLYWLFWLNLMLGTFNALPAGPLDGGQMFKATLRHLLYRRYGVEKEKLVVEKRVAEPGVLVRGVDPETQAKLDRVAVTMRRTSMALGLSILAMLFLPFIGAKIIGAFG